MSELFRVDGLWARPAEVSSTAADNTTDHVLRGLDLTVGRGEIHAIVGPEGSGASTLGATLLGSPAHEITAGTISLLGDDITDWPPDERAKAGIFLTFPRPEAIPGVSVVQLLGQALSARTTSNLSASELRLATMEWMKRFGMDPSCADRPLDDRVSNRDEQRHEILQLAILEPELAILDETDPDLVADLDPAADLGLDVGGDALRTVAHHIRQVRSHRPSMGVLLITHHQRLLDEIEPDHVHVLLGGRIVASGGMELAAQLVSDGYQAFEVPA